MSAAVPSVNIVSHERKDGLNSYLKQDKIFPSDLIKCFSGVHPWVSAGTEMCGVETKYKTAQYCCN